MKKAFVLTPWRALALVGALGFSPGPGNAGEEKGTPKSGEAATRAGGNISGKISFGKATKLKNDGKDFVDVVVSVEDIEMSDEDRKAAASRPPSVIDQKDMTFHPHVLPIVVGMSVDFPNSDPLFHNVYSSSDVNRFDLGMYPKGQSKQITFDKPGVIELRCKVHSEMQAFVVVKKNPFFARVKEDGTFLIENVPPGQHKLEVWHPKAETVAVEATVESGGTAEVNAELAKRRGR